MKLAIKISIGLFMSVYALLPAQTIREEKMLFDTGWKFHRGGAQRAEKPEFDDAAWRKLDLPHDWSIEDLPGTASPFHRDAISQVSGGFTTGGTGWYRKKFTIPADRKGMVFNLLFEGVAVNSEVWLNGELLGSHPYAYTSFYYDITALLKFGQENTIAVKVMNEGENSRWYTGSGIYRHVWLQVSNPLSIPVWGTSLVTTEINNALANVQAVTRLANRSSDASEIKFVTSIYDDEGEEAGKTESLLQMPSGSSQEITHTIEVKNPRLWSTGTPVLYKAISEIYQGTVLIHKTETPFGIRTIDFDVNNGFRLNGKTIKLKGGCVHHDNGPLGSRAYDRAEERRVELLKASGYNAIRCAHNPPSPAFLDACDRLGMLVIDEAFDMWKDAKNPFDYHLYFNNWWQRDIESMVMRDRNHPSVIMWSIGNEIPERGEPEGFETAKMLVDYVKQLDSTRPVTSAVNGLGPDKDPYFANLDISGYNYSFGGDHGKKSIFEIDHKRVADRIMYCAESYPLEAFGAWMDAEKYPYVLGDFVWTGFDYLGEASIGWRGYPHV
ncbi:MAG: hypothetical protein HC830_06610 [Bacteroidetes bacterium]|nr:hypothetical protein [Bacteroidota bacterium]